MGFFFLLSISFLSGVKLTAFYEQIFRGVKFSVNGYHLHHSLYGVVLIVGAALLHLHQVEAAILLCMTTFGLGSILQHTLSEHFVFIERENRESNRLEGWEETSETFFSKGIRVTFYRNDNLLNAEADAVCTQKSL
jgi:hypothetical protein